jgi:thiamine-monophosphate kinase
MDDAEPIGELGEFAVLAEIARILEEGCGPRADVLGIGDDAAILPPPPLGWRTVATVDALVEGVHFERRLAPPRLLGRKALSVNLSDIAAMGALPRFALLALTAPAHLPLGWVRDLARGFAERAVDFDVRVVGGNLTGGPVISVTVTVLGEVEADRAVTRAGGSPGDRLYVTGPLGASALGLALLRGAAPGPPEPVRHALIAAHLDPTPRIAEGRLAARHARAMIDLSDGLLGDLGHLCRASGCGAEIEATLLPRLHESDALASIVAGGPLAAALAGGEDYELLCAVSPAEVSAFEGAAAAHAMTFYPIGSLSAGGEITLIHADGRREKVGGRSYEHFR